MTPDNPLQLLYAWPSVSDRIAMALLGIGPRQLQKLIVTKKLTRAGSTRVHRIATFQLRARLGLPEYQPETFEPWAELLGHVECQNKSEHLVLLSST